MSEQRLRILFVSDVTSVHNHNWVRYLIQKGHEIVFLTVRPGDMEGVEVIYADPGDEGTKLSRIFAHLRFLCREWKLVSNGRFDIVHVHFLRGDAIGLVATFHPRSVITLWGSDARLPSEGGDPRRMWLRRKALERASTVTVVNQFLKRCANRFAPAIKRLEIVPFGVHLDLFEPKPLSDNVDSGSGNEKRSVKFLFAKPRLIPLYGIDLLISAFSKVLKSYPNAILYLAGREDSDQIGEIKASIRELNIAEQVIFTGELNRGQIVDLMRQCDILVQPSRWESFGVVMLEAMAMGLPVISTSVGGVPELVQDNVTGLIIPPDDVNALTNAMLSLANDRENCHRFGSNGRKMVQEMYDFNIHGEKMNALYYELAGSCID